METHPQNLVYRFANLVDHMNFKTDKDYGQCLMELYAIVKQENEGLVHTVPIETESDLLQLTKAEYEALRTIIPKLEKIGKKAIKDFRLESILF